MINQNVFDILQRCAEGDTSAFRLIVEEYQRYAFAIAFRIVRSDEDARDIVQEAFIRVWKNALSYDPSVKFTTWFYTILTNLCYDRIKAMKRRATVSLEESAIAGLTAGASVKDPENNYANINLVSVIETLAEELPPKQRMVFVLRDMQGLHIQEVCDILHLSEGSVKTNLVYARKYLREKLEPYIQQ